MSYVVTARKWRPQRFGDVISQSHVTETLKNAITSGRVGHAYLFSGPRGVGKTTIARIFAKALNCLNGPAEEPCNTCENCLSIQSGASMDIQELDGASNNSVEDVRNLISSVGYHASHCRYKMYIIDEVHMLSTPAFNALLKTIEEPPPNVIFIMATTEPHKIPATILSRCQRFDFHRLSVNDIAGKLRTIAEADGISIDDGSVMLIAQRAGGAMRDAESILEQMKSSHGGSITVADVNEVLGIADRTVFFDIVDKCRENDHFGVISLFRAYYDEGGDVKEFVEGLLSHFRDLLYAHYEKGIEHVMLDDDMKARVKEQSGWFNHGDLIRMIACITDVETSLAYAVLPVLRIEIALARLASMETTIQLKDLFERLGGDSAVSAVSETPAANVRRAVPSEATVSPSAPVFQREVLLEVAEGGDDDSAQLTINPDIDSITRSWRDIVALVSDKRPVYGTALGQAMPQSLDNGKLTLAFKSDHGYHCKALASNADEVGGLLGTVLGVPVHVVCTTVETGPGNGESGNEKKNNELDDLIAREPIIKEILDRFGGEINDTWRE